MFSFRRLLESTAVSGCLCPLSGPQGQHVFSPVLQSSGRMMAPPTHGQPSLVSSSTSQYPEQTHTMYGRWSWFRTRAWFWMLGSYWLFLLKCLQGQCLNSIHTLVPPCTHTHSTHSPLQPLQAKASRGGLHSMAVLPITQLPAQSSTNSTSRQQRVSNRYHQ